MSLQKSVLLLFLELSLITIILFTSFYIEQQIIDSWKVLGIGLFAYLCWHLYHLFQLLNCLKSGKSCIAPASMGIWQEVFSQLTQLQRQHNSRQKKLINILEDYRVFIEAIPDAAVILKQNNEVEWFNKNAQQYFGLKKKKHIGKKINKIIDLDDFDDFLYSSQSKNDSENNLQINSPVETNKILSLRIVPYPKNFQLLLARDISKIHQIGKMRKDFIANVSHELRTPLTVISGYLETLAEHFSEDVTFLHPILTMQQQSTRMENLVADLLLLSKLEGNEDKQVSKELIHIASMIEGIVNDAKLLNADKNHKIEVDIDTSLMIAGNQDELRSAFANLVSNAIRYTPSSGIITIKWYQKKESIYFTVTDNGDGIANKHIHRLTERFYRVDKGRSSNEGGTGLGLAIVKHILNHHKAKLEIKSKMTKGSTFSCQFHSM